MADYPELQKILYIEDEEDIRHLVDIALCQLGGLELKACANGSEGLTALQHYPAQMVLLDAVLPDMEGISVMQQMKAQAEHANTPVIFMTAKAQNEEIQLFRDLGAADVITKPFNPMTLADQLKTVWSQHGK